MSYTTPLRIGTAAWSVPAIAASSFPGAGSQLQRYSRTLNAVEINTSFYRDHKPETYERWARDTPDEFQFSVKLSRVFTHETPLGSEPERLKTVLSGVQHLGGKLGVILVQLPPKLAFEPLRAKDFFSQIRDSYLGPLVLEPRHKTWTSESAFELMKSFEVGKVRADPEPCPAGLAFEEANPRVRYIRWHGSPVMYESRYSFERLEALRADAEASASRYESVWVIFDNTMFAWATVNALELAALPENLSKNFSRTADAGPQSLSKDMMAK